jgi:hypothetical protein
MKNRVWKLLLAVSVLSLVLVGTALAQSPVSWSVGSLVYGRIHGNPGFVAELTANFTLHDLYVYVDWVYNDGSTIRDIWYFEQTLYSGDTIPLYAPLSHMNPWASVTGVSSWGYYDYTRGAGRCTYGKLSVTRCRWDSSYGGAVYGTVKNSGDLTTGYVAFAALYDSNIIAASWTEKEGVDANDTDNFAVGFAGVDLPRAVSDEDCWVFQGQWGWQDVGSIFPNESKTWPGLRNVCPSP